MFLYWLLLLPFTYSLIDESSGDLLAYNVSKEMDVLRDQLWTLANETAILIQLYNESIAKEAVHISDVYQYKSTNVTSLDKRNSYSPIDARVRDHLHKVYRHLMLMIATAGAGAATVSFQLVPLFVANPLIPTILFLVSSIAFLFSSHKMAFSLSTSFFAGSVLSLICLAPQMLAALPFALGGASLIFLTFTITALLAPSDAFLKWGGTLMSILLATAIVSLFSIFFPLSAGFSAIMTWISLVLFSVLVGYDTQKMIEKAKMGLTDHITDAHSLFLDLLNILLQILEILTNKNSKQN